MRIKFSEHLGRMFAFAIIQKSITDIPNLKCTEIDQKHPENYSFSDRYEFLNLYKNVVKSHEITGLIPYDSRDGKRTLIEVFPKSFRQKNLICFLKLPRQDSFKDPSPYLNAPNQLEH
jgi:hypothetical protein